MIIIGCDYHPGFQQIAFVDTETGDCGEQRLEHSEGAEKFYRDLAAQGKKVRVGMEASGHARWFERLLAELNFELWIGDATEIARKAGTASRRRIGRMRSIFLAVADGESFSQDLGSEWGESGICGNCYGIGTGWCRRCTRIMNQLKAVALNEGLRCKKKFVAGES